VRALVRELAGRGTTVVWATQRIEEIRGFADGVTLIDAGEIRFQGSVPELMDRAVPRQYLVRLRNGRAPGEDLSADLRRALSGQATIAPASEEDPERYRLALDDGVVLGEALSSLAAGGIDVLSCREERSEIEEAFLSLTKEKRS
jgi:ABC-2 type transport system ATP-binding protein